jgi:hypothetical protein
MAFGPHRLAATARSRRRAPRAAERRFVRHRALGTVALYEIIEERGELVTVEVLDAPGLAPGMRVALLKSATRAMEVVEAAALSRSHSRRQAASGPRAA